MGTHGGPGITAQGQEEPEKETGGEEERRRGDTSRDSCSTTAPLQSFCMHVLDLILLLCFDDGLEYLSGSAPGYTFVLLLLHVLY